MYLVFNIWMDHRKIIDYGFLQMVKKFKLELDMSSLTLYLLNLWSLKQGQKTLPLSGIIWI